MGNTTYRRKTVKRPRSRKPVIGLVVVGVLLLATAGALLFRHYHKSQDSTTGQTSSSTKTTKESTTNAGVLGKQETSNTPNSVPAKTPETGSASSSLKAPFGTFVSNHRPSLKGEWRSNEENSVCNTSPGATCEITFTKDGVTKSLGQKTVDANGAAYWNSWTIQDINLSEGTWTITAIAANNGKTARTNDQVLLEVQP